MRRRGFSLVEILIVLALLVIVVAIALPVAGMMYRNARPRAAADLVRAAMLQARTRALEEGRPYRFGYIPGGVAFRIAPDDDSFWTGSGEGTPPPLGMLPPLIRAHNLPGEVRFATANGNGLGGAGGLPANTSLNQQQEPDPRTIDTARFEPLVVFFSDGTAEQDVEITFEYPGTASLVLSLRALTGVSTVRTQVKQGGGNR